ncbi:ubiquitin-conjugating enzyme E2 T-like [Centruroides vittatus]|uniref:ubiquitin-conjugating enzyme E2 T-like n=1 Tax=Centruroides vittatus TaxID=120091 RepID=UPI0035102F10
MAQFKARMTKEMQMILKQTSPGIACWNVDGSISHLRATINGAQGTPYENGIFKLEIIIPEKYPFQPPNVTFTTTIYHPNIDTAGRICLDVLKLPPMGTWKPSLNVISVLTCIRQLMNEPNPDDPLMAEIAEEFKFNRPIFVQHAKEWTMKYAVSDASN